jgi:glutathione peroxidase
MAWTTQKPLESRRQARFETPGHRPPKALRLREMPRLMRHVAAPPRHVTQSRPRGTIKVMKTLLAALFLVSAVAFAASSIHEFTLNALDGKATPLANFKGKVVLVVNVASRCGYTPQYEGLQALYEKYQKQGLVIAGFPANNFGAQEPGTNAEIGAFCKATYGVTFPMFSKISVQGGDKAPLYQFLTDRTANPKTGGEIQWNFTKFLVDRNGKVIQRFEPEVEPLSRELVSAVESALK